MWMRGHIDLDDHSSEFKNFEYRRKPLNLVEEEQWHTSGYRGMTFGGELYDGTNLIPSWVETVAKQIGLHNCGYAFYRMKTGNIIPTHVDHYSVYTRVFNTPIEQVSRAIVFLEDWQSGHYFEIENKALTNWVRGDWVLWSYKESHSAANIGIKDRYTLQITGIRH